jgi:IclR family acetate operon transcriptional repressor
MKGLTVTAGNGSADVSAIRSVITALRTLEELSRGPMGVSDLSRSLDIPKTTAHRSLRTLATAGWVRMSETDRSKWVLTGRPLTVGLAGSVEGNLRELARSELTGLRDATGETVHLVVPDGSDLVVVARIDGTHSLRTFLPLGTHAPLHATASGRALLSVMTDDEVAQVLGETLPQFTPSTVYTRVEVLAEVERTRERGYALNAAEWRSDIAALGVPIVSRVGVPAAALAISMPLSRYENTDMPAMAELAMGAARRISEQLHNWQQSDTWLG